MFLFSRSLSPGTCALSWVSTRVFFSHLDPSQTRTQSSVLSCTDHGLLKLEKKNARKGKKGTFTDLIPTALSRLVVYSLVEAARQWRSSGSWFFRDVFVDTFFIALLTFFLDWVWNSTQLNFFNGRRRSVFLKGCFLCFNLLRVVSVLLWMKYLLSWPSLHEETHRGTRADFVLASPHLSYDYALPFFFKVV